MVTDECVGGGGVGGLEVASGGLGGVSVGLDLAAEGVGDHLLGGRGVRVCVCVWLWWAGGHGLIYN